MPDEQNYVAHLVTFDDARKHLRRTAQLRVLELAWNVYMQSLRWDVEIQEEEREHAR
jgi:hypothetical protein